MRPALLCAALAGTAAAQPASFDELAAAATPVDARDLAGLLWSALGACDDVDDLHRRQCRGVRAARGRDAASRTYLFRPGRGGVWVGDADEERGGVAYGLRGCLACEEPIDVGDGVPRHVVTRGSVHVAGGRLVAPDLVHGTRSFEDPADAARWRATPDRVRGEIVFRVTRDLWSQDGLHGVFVEPLGFRLADACDGTVLAASPPSAQGPIDATACGAAPQGPSLAREDDSIPAQLGAAQIREALAPAARDVDVCFESYGVPGKADVFLDVAGDGHVRYAEVRGPLAETPTATCIVAAMKKVRFPRFRRASMHIHYPFILR
jgi:hypothetical protein